VADPRSARADIFPSYIPLSADSQDILAYVDQPAQARKPVGYLWGYERSTQEYPAIKQDLAEPEPEPEPLRLAWRDFIKLTIHAVVQHPEHDPLSSIQQRVTERVPKREQSSVQALIVEELRRMHEGVFARYGLRPSEYAQWEAVRGH